MDLKVYPNPSDKHIIIETGCSQPSTFKLFDMTGRLVIVAEVSDQAQLSFKKLKPGMYCYKLISESRLQVGKIALGERVSQPAC
jgi:hypothetical protein